MVDLADRRVLRDEQAVAAAQLGDVAQQDHGAGHLVLVEERDAPQHHRRLQALLELGHGGRRLGQRLADRRLVEAELAQAHALGVGVHPHAVQRRHAVRRRVDDPALRVEEEHAVADAGRLLGLGLLGGVGERPLRDHPGEACEHIDVGALELTGLAADRRRRLAAEHADHLALPPHRDAEHAHPLLQRRDAHLALEDLAEAKRPSHDRPLLLVDDGADPVAAVHGLRGGRPDLAEDHERRLRAAHGGPQQEVGEAEVGQEPRPRRRAAACGRAGLDRGPSSSRASSARVATPAGYGSRLQVRSHQQHVQLRQVGFGRLPLGEAGGTVLEHELAREVDGVEVAGLAARRALRRQTERELWLRRLVTEVDDPRPPLAEESHRACLPSPTTQTDCRPYGPCVRGIIARSRHRAG